MMISLNAFKHAIKQLTRLNKERTNLYAVLYNSVVMLLGSP